MIIHLASGTQYFSKDSPYLQTIIQTIQENGDVLAANWLDGPVKPQKLNEAASKADLLIIEATNYDFNNGFDAAIATQTKKPVLLLSRNSLEGRSITGISNQYFTCHTYKTKDDLAAFVRDFLQQNALDSQDQRFNFFIDRQIYNYLRDKSYATGKSKSEIIRELLDREISGRNT